MPRGTAYRLDLNCVQGGTRLMALPEGSGTKEAVGPGGKGNVLKTLMGP